MTQGNGLGDIKFDHVGIAVKSLQEAVELFEKKLGGRCLWQSTFESQGVKSARIELGQAAFELMEPLSPESGVGKFVSRRGEGIHHLSLLVPDLEEAVSKYRKAGLEVSEIAKGERYRLAFVHPRSVHGILVELLERT